MSERLLDWIVDRWKDEWSVGPLYVQAPIIWVKRLGLWWPDAVAVWWGNRGGIMFGWSARPFVSRVS